MDVVPIPKLSSSLSAIEVVEILAQLKLPFHAAGYDNVTSTYVEDVTNNAIRIGQVCSDLVRLSFEQYGTSNAVWADDNAKIMLKVFADWLAEAGPGSIVLRRDGTLLGEAVTFSTVVWDERASHYFKFVAPSESFQLEFTGTSEDSSALGVEFAFRDRNSTAGNEIFKFSPTDFRERLSDRRARISAALGSETAVPLLEGVPGLERITIWRDDHPVAAHLTKLFADAVDRNRRAPDDLRSV